MSFRKSLNIGQIGESLYHQAHEGILERLDGFKSDFRVIENGKGVELKTDTYSMASTPNFFIERFSNKDKQTPGGPWQCLANGSSLFAYMYVTDFTIFTFDVNRLVGALEPIIESMEPTLVRNSTYTTQGYRVPRELLADIATVSKLRVSIK